MLNIHVELSMSHQEIYVATGCFGLPRKAGGHTEMSSILADQ